MNKLASMLITCLMLCLWSRPGQSQTPTDPAENQAALCILWDNTGGMKGYAPLTGNNIDAEGNIKENLIRKFMTPNLFSKDYTVRNIMWSGRPGGIHYRILTEQNITDGYLRRSDLIALFKDLDDPNSQARTLCPRATFLVVSDFIQEYADESKGCSPDSNLAIEQLLKNSIRPIQILPALMRFNGHRYYCADQTDYEPLLWPEIQRLVVEKKIPQTPDKKFRRYAKTKEDREAAIITVRRALPPQNSEYYTTIQGPIPIMLLFLGSIPQDLEQRLVNIFRKEGFRYLLPAPLELTPSKETKETAALRYDPIRPRQKNTLALGLIGQTAAMLQDTLVAQLDWPVKFKGSDFKLSGLSVGVQDPNSLASAVLQQTSFTVEADSPRENNGALEIPLNIRYHLTSTPELYHTFRSAGNLEFNLNVAGQLSCRKLSFVGKIGDKSRKLEVRQSRDLRGFMFIDDFSRELCAAPLDWQIKIPVSLAMRVRYRYLVPLFPALMISLLNLFLFRRLLFPWLAKRDLLQADRLAKRLSIILIGLAIIAYVVILFL
jgi:hypothetical protein